MADNGNDYIWEMFDALWKSVHRQGVRIEELEARVIELEESLAKRHEQLRREVLPFASFEPQGESHPAWPHK